MDKLDIINTILFGIEVIMIIFFVFEIKEYEAKLQECGSKNFDFNFTKIGESTLENAPVSINIPLAQINISNKKNDEPEMSFKKW